MEMTIQMWLSIGISAYYAALQLYDDFIRVTSKVDRNNHALEGLRSKYGVTIRVFRAKQPYGFTSLRSIWVNELLVKSEKALMFTFHHEHYHLKKKHKQWLLTFRLLISMTPLTVYFVNWWIFILILLTTAYLVEVIRKRFEKKANNYAHKMTSNDS